MKETENLTANGTENTAAAAGNARIAAAAEAAKNAIGAQESAENAAAARMEAAQDAAHHRFVVGPIHAGHADGHHLGHRRPIAERAVDHLVERLLRRELAGAVQVGAAAAPLAEHAAVLIRQPGDGLAAAGVDAEHVHI